MMHETKHLWEVDHPYYMNEGNYFEAGQHTRWLSWQDFEREFKDSDLDYNWFVRWDWLEGEDSGGGTYNGDDYYRHAVFMLQMIGQRKAYLCSHEIAVCRADEPTVRAFLQKRWEYMQQMWEPFARTVTEIKPE
ncbi:hypothetical protein MesoLjLc_50910 [Mesorhizobium sp. L-8-10]|uniref:hypothetical protein n=1 Tax=Mesorhizobium sp. L-8-10 TaxID=2744523 RepID=UPI0019278054|nr:hypothetical protein [Mesorhizobium sp. L-8-10]BCH33161.1 hypothetical protein MesoLjLc_50910 [Mesorhizobium sp. L-8-10]